MRPPDPHWQQQPYYQQQQSTNWVPLILVICGVGVLLLVALIGLGAWVASQAPGIGEDTTLTSSDGLTMVTVPPGWSSFRTGEENAGVTLQAGDKFEETYVQVFTEAKVDLVMDMSLEDYSKICREALMGNINNAKIKGGPQSRKINGSQAIEYEIRGQLDTVRIVYLHTSVETDGHFHQVITWTLPSRFDQKRDILRKVTSSFRLVKKDNKTGKTPKTKTAESPAARTD